MRRQEIQGLPVIDVRRSGRVGRLETCVGTDLSLNVRQLYARRAADEQHRGHAGGPNLPRTFHAGWKPQRPRTPQSRQLHGAVNKQYRAG